MPTAPLRAASYRRISSTSEESTSLEGQSEITEAYCISQGWHLVETYTDDGISGGKDHTERPGLARLMEDAERGKFDVMVIAKLDRLARSLTIWNDTRKTLAAQGVLIAAVAESLDLTSPAGRMMANVLASFAEFERERIGERIREAQGRMARDGRYFHGPTPFGWFPVSRDDGPGLRLALHPEHGPYLRRVVDRILSGDLTAGAAVSEAEAAGFVEFPSPTGIRRLLRNPILLGQQVHNGEAVTGDDGLPITPHDALVTPSEFRALDETMRQNQNGTPRPASGELRLLNALQVLHCGDCGRPLQLQRRKNDRDVYACRKGHVSADANGADEAVSGYFLERLGGFDVTVSETVGDPAASERLLTARKRRDDLAGLVVEGLMPAETARGHLETIGVTIARLEAEVAAGVEEVFTSTGETFGETWDAADMKGRRAILRESGLTVTVARAGRGHRPPMRDRMTFSYAS